MSEFGFGWKIPLLGFLCIMAMLFASGLYLAEEIALSQKASEEIFY